MELAAILLKYYRTNKKWSKIVLGILFPIIGVGAAIFGVIAAYRQNAPVITLATSVAILTISIQCVLMYNIALIWINEYYIPAHEQDRPKVAIFTSALKFAEHKHHIISNIDSLPPNSMVYASCHDNFFVNPDGPEQEKVAVREANTRVFTRLAELILRGEMCGLRLFMQYDENGDGPKNMTAELKTRGQIFTKVAEQLKKRWVRHNFQYVKSNSKSVKDYLVINEHVFKTIKKTHHEDEMATYVHIKHQKLAEAYAVWMHNIFYDGRRDNYVVEINVKPEELR
jgi:hypothetical protein